MLFGCPPLARAEQSPPRDERYDALVREAVREFDATNYAEARTLFEEAHARKPSARTLRGLGICAYELKHYVQAIAELEAALRDARNPLTEAQRAEVSATLSKARRFVGTLVIEVQPPASEVALDSQPTDKREVVLEVGDHNVSASAPGYRSGQVSVTLEGGKSVTARLRLLPLELGPAAAARSTEPQSAPATTSATTPANDRSVFKTWWFWTAAGAVVAGAAVGTALALSSGSKNNPGYMGSTGVALRAP